jgi:hypothetical protein
MKRIASHLLWIVCSAVAMPAGAAGADAQRDYPAKPIRMVVPFPPGAASDFLARTVGQKARRCVRPAVVVDNRPGGGGVVGSVVVARAAPDGYTLSLIGTPHIVNALLAAEPQYRPLEDFTPITQVASLPNLLVVSPGAPVSSVQELIALAKSRPGQLNFGSAGIGSLSHMAGELFKQAAGIDTVHIPFKLLSDAVTEMMARPRALLRIPRYGRGSFAQGRQAAAARGDDRQTAGVAAERADHGRGGLAQFPFRRLVWRGGAREIAAPARRSPQRGYRARPAPARYPGEVRAPGRRAGCSARRKNSRH